MIQSIPSSFFSQQELEIRMNKIGQLQIQNQKNYQIKLFSGEKNSLFTENERNNIQLFFAHFLQSHSIDFTKEKIKNFIVTAIDSNKIAVSITLKDMITKLRDTVAIKLEDSSLKSLFDHTQCNQAPESSPLFELAEVKRSSLLGSIHHLFKKLVKFVFGKSTPLTREIVSEFKGLVGRLSLNLQRKIYGELKKVSSDERTIIGFLREHIDLTGLNETEVIYQILMGAYVILDDGGETYQQWATQLQTAQERMSSHESDDKQYAIRGTVVKECLFSRKQLKNEDGTSRPVTWFQLERYPAKFGYYTAHLWTYLLYKIYHKNQGPYGSSPHLERSNPLILRLQPLKQEKVVNSN